MQLVAQHRRPHRQLQYGVGDPERGLLVSGHQPVFLPAGGATVDGVTAIRSSLNSNLSRLAEGQCTKVIESNGYLIT